MSKTLKPYGPRVLVGEIGLVETTLDSGLVLPPAIEERKGLTRGLVIAVGDEVSGIEPEDVIYYRKGYQWDVQGKIIVQTPDIIAVETSE